MPLNTRKLNHLHDLLVRAMAGRSQDVILTLKAADGSTSTLTVPAIFRLSVDADPRLAGHSGSPGAPDVLAQFMQTDVTLDQLRACVKITLPPGTTGPDLANAYAIRSIAIKGLQPGGDRFICAVTRLG